MMHILNLQAVPTVPTTREAAVFDMAPINVWSTISNGCGKTKNDWSTFSNHC
jgi:hypothetical protein